MLVDNVLWTPPIGQVLGESPLVLVQTCELRLDAHTYI